METLKFKTDIKCSGCVSKVTPAMDEAVGSNHWEVDIENPDKILTVSSNKLNEKEIESAIKRAGFTVAKIG